MVHMGMKLDAHLMFNRVLSSNIYEILAEAQMKTSVGQSHCAQMH